MIPALRWLGAVAGIALLAGCGLFAGKPALPKHASLEPADAPGARPDFPALVAQADIIYFPAEWTASGGRSEPAAQLLEALRKSGAPYAVGWDLLDATQQPLLDQLATETGAAREETIAHLEVTGTGRAREHFRYVLRDARFFGVPQFALRCPPSVLAKVDARQPLTPEEEALFTGGYSTPPRGFELFADRLSASSNSNEQLPERTYRGQVASQQFMAERIVRQFRSGPPGRLLIFLHSSDLDLRQGVPRYVGQKLKARQLVLDSSGNSSARPKLLTARGRIRGIF
ncbi:MAG: ChaN family lipoprotein [Chthoniobacterales bacterium]